MGFSSDKEGKTRKVLRAESFRKDYNKRQHFRCWLFFFFVSKAFYEGFDVLAREKKSANVSSRRKIKFNSEIITLLLWRPRVFYDLFFRDLRIFIDFIKVLFLLKLQSESVDLLDAIFEVKIFDIIILQLTAIIRWIKKWSRG